MFIGLSSECMVDGFLLWLIIAYCSAICVRLRLVCIVRCVLMCKSPVSAVNM